MCCSCKWSKTKDRYDGRLHIVRRNPNCALHGYQVQRDFFDDTAKPLDDFFAALMRVQSFRDRPDVTESFAGNSLGNQPGQGGPFVP
jgi:hypothetical protein